MKNKYVELKNIKFPFVDLDTEEIYGCEEGSWMWYHEKGHIEFNKLELAGRLKLIQGYIFWIWMFAVTIGILNRYMFFISTPLFFIYIGIEIYEERWCNKYADRNIIKQQKTL